MTQKELETLLKDLQALPKECEWAEFKIDYWNPQEIGKYLSALANSACYHEQNFGYLVFGIEDETHRLAGTKFKPLHEKKGNQELENWIAIQLNPRVNDLELRNKTTRLHPGLSQILSKQNLLEIMIQKVNPESMRNIYLFGRKLLV